MKVRHAFYQSIFWRVLFFISSLILNIAIARVFEAESTGWFYYVITTLTLIIQIAGLSLESGLGYFSAKRQIPVSKLARLSILWGLFVGIISSLFVGYILPDQHNEIVPGRWLLACSGCYIAGNLIIVYLSSFFYADFHFRIPNLIGVVTNAALLISLLVIASGVPEGTLSMQFVIFFFTSFLLQAGVMIYFFHKRFHEIHRGLPSWNEFTLLIRYTAMAYFANLIFFLLYRIDYYFVRKYCSEKELGNYIQVSRLAHLFFILPGILAGVVFSLSIKQEKEMVHKILLPLSRILLYLFLVASLGVAMIGKLLFPFLFGPSFDLMHKPFFLLVPGIVALCALYPLTAFYAGKNKIINNIKGSLIALIIIVTGNILLVPKFGINGAALVSSVGYLSYYLYVYVILKSEFTLKLSDFLFPKKNDMSVLKAFFNKNGSADEKG